MPPLCPSLCPSPTGDSAISFVRSYFLNVSFILLIDSSGSGEMLHGFARLDGFFLNGIDLIRPLIPGMISFSFLSPFLACSPSRFSYVVICSNFLGFIDRPINRLMPSSCRWEAVKEGVDEMIKLLANEPSVGLFFVEQHARTSMPYLLGLKVCVSSSPPLIPPTII